MNQGKTNTQLKALLDKVRASIHSTYFRMPAFAQSRSRDQLAPVPGEEREDESDPNDPDDEESDENGTTSSDNSG